MNKFTTVLALSLTPLLASCMGSYGGSGDSKLVQLLSSSATAKNDSHVEESEKFKSCVELGFGMRKCTSGKIDCYGVVAYGNA